MQGFFHYNNLSCTIEPEQKFTYFSAKNIELLCGDVFDLSVEDIVTPNAIYDHSALVALPTEIRELYVHQLTKLSKRGTLILLVAFETDKLSVRYLPFPVRQREIKQLFNKHFDIEQLEHRPIIPINPLSNEHSGYPMFNTVYLLKRR
ncbi:MAG: hypothetical protein A3E87_04670 [Gammaproteobacteria bacterium RIFCSPHIGHO2_12_FULL_35_23]|nr:MAG: hypothetical protein A3E87_04670 [Gammaproteobacteria bacterium RIFCSPHIGHO2_12_FULL_35_23]